jgi:hypothetical protein
MYSTENCHVTGGFPYFVNIKYPKALVEDTNNDEL